MTSTFIKSPWLGYNSQDFSVGIHGQLKSAKIYIYIYIFLISLSKIREKIPLKLPCSYGEVLFIVMSPTKVYEQAE